MKYLFFITWFFICLGCKPKHENIGKLVSEIPNKISSINVDSTKLDTLDIDYQIQSDFFAYSSDKNKKRSNGEAHSTNLPKIVDDNFPKGSFYLTVNQNELTSIDSMRIGHKLYLVNTTDKAINITGIDSRIYILIEALNDFYQWKPISFLPPTFCGNSYHEIVLDKNEYWDFKAPIFKGNYKTKLRYVLYLDRETCVYSNEIDASINKLQFDETRRKPHKSSNLMDTSMD
jgi:hypothetical protein